VALPHGSGHSSQDVREGDDASPLAAQCRSDSLAEFRQFLSKERADVLRGWRI
jgi:hypothetical protein